MYGRFSIKIPHFVVICQTTWLAIYLTKNKNTILLIIKSFKLVKTFKKRNKIGLSGRITI
jgi:hypothetical protein